MNNILKPITLRLNSAWSPIGFITPKQAIIGLCDGSDESGLAAMNIEYDINPLTGEYDFSNPTAMYPVRWDEWINLPIREYDMYISTSQRRIRLPTVTIALNYSRMPMKEQRPTKSNIYARDGGIDQYTGKPLTKKQASVDHIVPESIYENMKGTREGVNSWENLVLCDKNLNFRKGNKLNEEIGLKLIRKPKAPSPMPVSAFIREAKLPDWVHFLHK